MATASSTFAAADGDGYELQMGRWSRRLAPQFLDFAGTAGAERVLDVGCGTGSLALALAARTPPSELIGIDVSPVYVDYARGRTRDPRLSFQEGDACALPFADGRFDRVLSLLMLHFVPDAGRAVAEMRRVARPGAVVAAAVWDNRGGTVSTRVFWDTAAALFPAAVAQRARHCTRPMTRPGELAQALRVTGLERIEEACLVTRMDFASFDDLWAPYEGRDGPVAAWVGTLDADDRARLRDAVRSAYLDGEPDGPRSYAALAWAARGVVPG
jgi:SAM-dependent methyltransferase